MLRMTQWLLALSAHGRSTSSTRSGCGSEQHRRGGRWGGERTRGARAGRGKARLPPSNAVQCSAQQRTCASSALSPRQRFMLCRRASRKSSTNENMRRCRAGRRAGGWAEGRRAGRRHQMGRCLASQATPGTGGPGAAARQASGGGTHPQELQDGHRRPGVSTVAGGLHRGNRRHRVARVERGGGQDEGGRVEEVALPEGPAGQHGSTAAQRGAAREGAGQQERATLTPRAAGRRCPQAGGRPRARPPAHHSRPSRLTARMEETVHAHWKSRAPRQTEATMSWPLYSERRSPRVV